MIPASVERWRDLVTEQMDEYWSAFGLGDGVDWFLALIWQESSGRPDAISTHGAVGLTQLMPATAAEVGTDDRTDPEQAIRGGIIYLKRQYDRLPDRDFPSDYPHISRFLLALASYNCGRGYVEKALKMTRRDGDAEWWTWHAVSEALPSAKVRGKTARYEDVRDYVRWISKKYRALVRG